MPPRELADDYRLEKILSSSRGGSILRASRIDTGQTVVIKLINVPAVADPAHAPKIAARFQAYAAGLARLRHPNLPLVIDSGLTPDGGAFLVMEKLDGVGFDADLAPSGAGASPDRILPLLAQALAGLEELARHGLAHLNLCPENLLLVPAEPAALPAIGGADAPAQTIKLLGLGTPLFHLGEPWLEAPSARFRAPELAMPSAAQESMPDWHADCYALALTACYALGATVAVGEVARTVVHAVQMPLALSFELANDEALRQILERCLRQSPAERPAHSAIRDAFGQALGRIELPGSGAASPDPRDTGGAGAIAESRESGELGGFGAPSDPGADWRSLLGESRPSDLPPGWANPGPADASSASGRAAGEAAAESSPALAASAGSDSFFDLFDVPATLPALPPLPPLPETAEPPTTGTSFGFQFPEGLELPQVDDLFAPGPAGPAAGGFAGLNADAPPPAPLWSGEDLSPQPAAAFQAPRPAGIAAIPGAEGAAGILGAKRTAGVLSAGRAAGGLDAEQRARVLGAEGTAERLGAERTAGVPGAAGTAGVPGAASNLAVPWTAGTAPKASGAAAVAPRPEVAAPRNEPATTGEQLSGVDELLGALPPPPLTPPPAPPAGRRGARGGPPGGGRRAGGAAGAVASRGAPAPAAALRPGTAALAYGRKLLASLLALPRPVLMAAAGALLLAAGVTAWVLTAHGSRQAQSAARTGVGAPPAAAPLRPGRSAAAKFFDARSYLIFGRDADARVRQALRELTYADQGALGPNGCRQLAAIEQTLAASALETAPQDLASGLRAGDLGTLENVVAVTSDRDLPPRQRGDLERARSLVNQYERAQAAAAGGDQAQVLERFRAVEGLSRTWRDPLELRDHAAQALEAEARALAIDGRYEEALGRLGPILRNWPERAGIKDLAKRYETASASEPQQLALLESVPLYESRRKPSEALDLLRPQQPTPHLEQRFAEAKQRLEAQLAQLDAQPPEVVLRPGYPLDYWRGTVVTLSFRVTDDYEVKSVKVFARPEAGRLTEMPLQRAGFGWDVKIPPSFHQNGTVELYVVATDLSGHKGYLGSKENPLHLKRRQGFQQLLH